MMASMAEQRRFLMNIRFINTAKLQQIQADLVELIQNGNATAQDIQFAEKIDAELNWRGRNR